MKRLPQILQTRAISLVLVASFLLTSACTGGKGKGGSSSDSNYNTPGSGQVTHPTPVVVSPLISMIVPAWGPLHGGTLLNVFGKGFQPGSKVTLDGVACSHITMSSSTKLICVTPGHIEGFVDITVTNPDKQVTTLTSAYQYVGTPNPVAGFAAVSGGGIMTGNKMRMRATIDGVGDPVPRVTNRIGLKSGIQGVIFP